MTSAVPPEPMTTPTARRMPHATLSRPPAVLAGALVLLTVLPRPAAEVVASESAALRRFEEHVRPLLIDRCQKCHSGTSPKGGLLLDSASGLAQGGDSGPAVIPGQPDDSLLIRAIRQQEDPKMPPQGRLSDEEIETLASWVREGAVWPESGIPGGSATDVGARNRSDHWAFQPVSAHAPPAAIGEWARHPIDRWMYQAWRQQSLNPVPLADRRTLFRRLTFDLTGLPPDPQAMQAFLDDDAPEAWERAVDRGLASPQYGECWGRHWLDVARYADTAGDNADYPIPEARRYRDYVIDSLNSDKPYDEFVREQLAGDLIAPADDPQRYAECVTATTFVALSRRYATAPYELWHLTLENTIDTVGQAFLGLTLRCARCHDHKFDPVSARDYYALYGIFDSTQYAWAGAEEFASKKFNREHFVPLLPPAEAAPRFAAFELRLAELTREIEVEEHDGELARRVAEWDEKIAAWTAQEPEVENPVAIDLPAARAARDAAASALKQRLDALRAELQSAGRPGLPPDLPGAYGVSEGRIHDAVIQVRGEPTRSGPEVPRGAVASLELDGPLQIPAGHSGRLELAQWMTRPDHPLTARVMVNRIWQHHFGRGIVDTPSNFGTRGSLPSHPELLDWLATEFVNSGWSVKAMHRLILTSRTWRLASQSDPADFATDPGNRFCWRHDPRRLEAEAIRDALLCVGGRLDPGRSGDHPFPPMTTWGFTQHSQFKAVYPTARRSVYLMTQRLQRHPFLALFDGPDPNTTTGQRTSATVPSQALYLLNNPEVRADAEAFAGRLLGDDSTDSARIQRAHQIAYGRPASDEEIQSALEFLGDYRNAPASGEAVDEARGLAAWTSYCRILLAANEFLFID